MMDKMKAGFKTRAEVVRPLVRKMGDNMRNLCHAQGCKSTFCPDQCACKKRRANPLDLQTALIWTAADCLFKYTSLLNRMRWESARECNSKDSLMHMQGQYRDVHNKLSVAKSVACLHYKHRTLNNVVNDARMFVEKSWRWIRLDDYVCYTEKDICDIVAKMGRRRNLGGKIPKGGANGK